MSKTRNSICALAMALAFTALAAPHARAQQQPQKLPTLEQRTNDALKDQISELSMGIVRNVGMVRAQQDEIDRLAAEVKTLRDKCGKACDEAKK